MQREGGRYAHAYHGHSTSRGSRFLSKIYKGVNPGKNIEGAFKEVEKIRERTKQKMTISKDEVKSRVKSMMGKKRR